LSKKSELLEAILILQFDLLCKIFSDFYLFIGLNLLWFIFPLELTLLSYLFYTFWRVFELLFENFNKSLKFIKELLKDKEFFFVVIEEDYFDDTSDLRSKFLQLNSSKIYFS